MDSTIDTKSFIDQLRKIYKNSVEESTLGIYKDHLKRARDVLGLQTKNIKQIINDPLQLEISLKGIGYSQSLITNMLKSFATIAKKLDMDESLISKYENINVINQENMDSIRMNNMVSEKNIDKWAKWDDIIKVYDKINTDTLSSTMNKLIVGLYTRLSGYVPRLDFAYMIVIPEDEVDLSDKEKDNYIYFDTKNKRYVIVLNDYKTFKRYGKMEIPVKDKSLNTLIQLWFEKYNVFETWLLINTKDNEEPLSEKALSKRIPQIFKKYLGKKINNGILRQSYESHIIYDNENEYKNMPLDEKIKVHKKLMHSFATAHEYAKKE